MRIAFGFLLAGHAAVHAVMWALPFTDAVHDMPFNPADSWLLGHRPVLAASLSRYWTVGIALSAALALYAVQADAT